MRSNDAKITGAVGNTVANDTVFKDNNVCLYQIASQVLTCVFVQTVPEFVGTKTYLINLTHLVERTFFGVFGTCHQDTTPKKSPWRLWPCLPVLPVSDKGVTQSMTCGV